MVDYYAKIRGAPRKYAYKLFLKYLCLAFLKIFYNIKKKFGIIKSSQKLQKIYRKKWLTMKIKKGTHAIFWVSFVKIYIPILFR